MGREVVVEYTLTLNINLPELKSFPPEFAIVTHLLYLGAKACAQSNEEEKSNDAQT